MRIGVNGTYLIPGRVGGTEIYLRHLLNALPAAAAGRHEVDVLVNQESEGAHLTPAARGFTQWPTGVRATNRAARILWEQLALPRIAVRRGYDVLFHPGFTAPWRSRVPGVATFHDLQYREHPGYFRTLDRWAWRVILDGVARRVERIICISAATQRAFARFYPMAAARSVCVPSGVDPEFFRRPWQPDCERPYLLCVSTLHPHKNLPRLIRAFAQVRRRQPGLRLVLAGMGGFAEGEVRRTITDLHLDGAVTVPGWLPREDLYALYAGAYAAAFPSGYEGFGLPVLEALAMGIPLACSALPVLDELAGDAAVRFHPESDDELLTALETVTRDESRRARLSAAGPEQARKFDWNRTAAATLRVLEEAAVGTPSV